MQSKFVYAIFALVLIAVTVTVSWELGHFLVQQSQETLFGVILALLAAAAGVSSIAVVATYSKLYTIRQQCLMLLRDLAFERKEHANFRTDAQAQIRTLRAKLRSETESAQHAAAGAREQVQTSAPRITRESYVADYTSQVQAPSRHTETVTPLNPVNVAVAATLLDYSASAESSVPVSCAPVTLNTPTVIETSACSDTSSYNSGGSYYCDSGGSSYCDSGSSNTGD